MANRIYIVAFGNNDYYIRLATYLVNKISKKHSNCIPITYSKSDLPQSMIDFCEQHKKGYGFFIWKPFIVEKTLALMDHNDILLYIDGRTYYTGKIIPELDEIIVNKSLDAIFWKMDGLYEYQFTKGDIFHSLNIRDKKTKESSQIAATFFIIKNNNRTTELIQAWNRFMNENRVIFIDESSSIPNEIGFIEKRHDQPVLSLLVKSSKDLNVKFISSNDVSKGPLKPHSLPHSNEYPKFVTFLPFSFIRILYTFRKLKFKLFLSTLVSRYIINSR